MSNQPGSRRTATGAVRPEVGIAAQAVARLGAIDALRGGAIVLMVCYHLGFDLAWFQLLQADFNHDTFWLASRALIVSMFLLVAGVSLALWDGRHRGARQFRARELRIGACALLVTAGSYAVFPRTFIFFGILHFIFVASLVGSVLVRLRWKAWTYAVAGALGVLAGTQFSQPVFDSPLLQWIGFMTHKPSTEDYVPMFPWFGVYLLGIAAGRVLLVSPAALKGFKGGGSMAATALAWMGRHSLAIYMLHQPVLLGILYLLFRQL